MSEPADAEPPVPPEAAESMPEAPLGGLVRWLRARGAKPEVLMGLALGLTALSVFTILVGFLGFGGVLGLLALLFRELALVPAEPGDPPLGKPYLRGLSLVVDLAILIGITLQAQHDAPFRSLLALVALALFAWLAWLRILTPADRPTARGLWRRPERLGILLVGLVLGRTTVVLFAVLGVGALDAWLKLERLRKAPATDGAPPGPAFMATLLGPDGGLHPIVRWGSLALVVLVLLVLPRDAGWRF